MNSSIQKYIWLALLVTLAILVTCSTGKEIPAVKTRPEKNETLILREFVCIADPVAIPGSNNPPPPETSVCPPNSLCIDFACYCKIGYLPEGNVCNHAMINGGLSAVFLYLAAFLFQNVV